MIRKRWRENLYIQSPVLDVNDYYALIANIHEIETPGWVGASGLVPSTMPDGDQPDGYRYPTVNYVAEACRRGAQWHLVLGGAQDAIAGPRFTPANGGTAEPHREMTDDQRATVDAWRAADAATRPMVFFGQEDGAANTPRPFPSQAWGVETRGRRGAGTDGRGGSRRPSVPQQASDQYLIGMRQQP